MAGLNAGQASGRDVNNAINALMGQQSAPKKRRVYFWIQRDDIAIEHKQTWHCGSSVSDAVNGVGADHYDMTPELIKKTFGERTNTILDRNGKPMGKTKKEAKPEALNLDELNKLVLPKEKIDDILSVIKQHGKKDVIFKDWGLDETLIYGKGMTMLFHGPPGTGKTFAANCIAKALGKELYAVENADIESPFPGMKEQAVKAAFEKATKEDKVLLFDECDSLLMSRDNVGMIIGAEINCLLTAIEKFEGVCVLATNRIGELDAALQRRISLILEFPEPTRDQRTAIWNRLIPKKMPLGKDVDIAELSDLELTGGYIKNAVLAAARHAIAEDADKVSRIHFLKAIKSISDGQNAFDTPSRSPRTIGKIRASDMPNAH